jgi:hypothetical protein
MQCKIKKGGRASRDRSRLLLLLKIDPLALIHANRRHAVGPAYLRVCTAAGAWLPPRPGPGP